MAFLGMRLNVCGGKTEVDRSIGVHLPDHKNHGSVPPQSNKVKYSLRVLHRTFCLIPKVVNSNFVEIINFDNAYVLDHLLIRNSK